MADPLGRADVNSLTQRSPIPIQAHLAKYANGAMTPWLRPGHPYPNGRLPRGTAINAVTPADLVEMVAVSGPLHCTDGWSYLARGLTALLAGDGHAARHLAYYAELRAALSLLASDGIGIFDGRNFVIDANGAGISLKDRGTHDIVWAALRAWSEQTGTFPRIADAVKISGVKLIDALQSFFPGSVGTALGSTLISTWGFDLSAGANDRDQRNYSSYVATDLDRLIEPASSDAQFVSDIWRSFEPAAWGLERHLLRQMLELEIASLNADPMSARQGQYDGSDPRLRAAVSFDFLSRATSPQEHPIIAAAGDLGSLGAKPMLARAALLLRLSTSLVRANLDKAGVDGLTHLEDWWAPFGRERGFWSTASAPSDMSELWMEIEDALGDVNAANTSDRSSMIRSLQTSLHLTQTDRVPLWSLCA